MLRQSCLRLEASLNTTHGNGRGSSRAVAGLFRELFGPNVRPMTCDTTEEVSADAKDLRQLVRGIETYAPHRQRAWHRERRILQDKHNTRQNLSQVGVTDPSEDPLFTSSGVSSAANDVLKSLYELDSLGAGTDKGGAAASARAERLMELRREVEALSSRALDQLLLIPIARGDAAMALELLRIWLDREASFPSHGDLDETTLPLRAVSVAIVGGDLEMAKHILKDRLLPRLLEDSEGTANAAALGIDLKAAADHAVVRFERAPTFLLAFLTQCFTEGLHVQFKAYGRALKSAPNKDPKKRSGGVGELGDLNKAISKRRSDFHAIVAECLPGVSMADADQVFDSLLTHSCRDAQVMPFWLAYWRKFGKKPTSQQTPSSMVAASVVGDSSKTSAAASSTAPIEALWLLEACCQSLPAASSSVAEELADFHQVPLAASRVFFDYHEGGSGSGRPFGDADYAMVRLPSQVSPEEVRWFASSVFRSLVDSTEKDSSSSSTPSTSSVHFATMLRLFTALCRTGDADSALLLETEIRPLVSPSMQSTLAKLAISAAIRGAPKGEAAALLTEQFGEAVGTQPVPLQRHRMLLAYLRDGGMVEVTQTDNNAPLIASQVTSRDDALVESVPQWWDFFVRNHLFHWDREAFPEADVDTVSDSGVGAASCGAASHAVLDHLSAAASFSNPFLASEGGEAGATGAAAFFESLGGSDRGVVHLRTKAIAEAMLAAMLLSMRRQKSRQYGDDFKMPALSEIESKWRGQLQQQATDDVAEAQHHLNSLQTIHTARRVMFEDNLARGMQAIVEGSKWLQAAHRELFITIFLQLGCTTTAVALVGFNAIAKATSALAATSVGRESTVVTDNCVARATSLMPTTNRLLELMCFTAHHQGSFTMHNLPPLPVHALRSSSSSLLALVGSGEFAVPLAESLLAAEQDAPDLTEEHDSSSSSESGSRSSAEVFASAVATTLMAMVVRNMLENNAASGFTRFGATITRSPWVSHFAGKGMRNEIGGGAASAITKAVLPSMQLTRPGAKAPQSVALQHAHTIGEKASAKQKAAVRPTTGMGMAKAVGGLVHETRTGSISGHKAPSPIFRPSLD